jgi:hypothetical protein
MPWDGTKLGFRMLAWSNLGDDQVEGDSIGGAASATISTQIKNLRQGIAGGFGG